MMSNSETAKHECGGYFVGMEDESWLTLTHFLAFIQDISQTKEYTKTIPSILILWKHTWNVRKKQLLHANCLIFLLQAIKWGLGSQGPSVAKRNFI